MDPVPMQGDGDVALYVADCSPLAMQSDGAGDEWVLGFPAHGQALRSQLTETKARQTGRKECSGIGDFHVLQPVF